MYRYLSRFLVAALIVTGGAAMTVIPLDADAARVGGGSSSGRQSSNVTKKTAPATTSTATPAKPAAAPAAAAPAAATPKPSGASRWLGPLAGIAAGLGIAALLSHFGMSGAVADFLVMALLAAVVVFGVMFVIRMLRGGASRPAYQAAGSAGAPQDTGMLRESAAPAYTAPQASSAAAPIGSGTSAHSEASWFIPSDFDTPRFLQEAKQQFVAIQKIWDSGDVSQLRNFLTDDLAKELQPQLAGRNGENHTEVVMLNAELLGIEKVTDGHLASVRFSGMLREQVGAEAFRFEEVWNLFKPEQGGWLLAGIQQIPVEHAS